MSLSTAWSEVSFDGQGRHVGVVRFEHSVHRSAYGTIAVPLAVFSKGAGPTLFAMAGSHGDEYEGQVELARLIRNLDVARLRGRLIVMPVANLPAALAATRTSPLDSGNLNRSFGYGANETLTGQIAHFISETILPLCDVFFDIHSGGSSLDHLPCSYADLGVEPKMQKRTYAALEAMNAPLSWVQPGVPDAPVAGRAALRQGVMHLSGEFGGGGRLGNDAAWHASRCIYRLLDHLEMYPLDEKFRAMAPTRLVTNTQADFIYARENGVFERLVELGDPVEKGQLVGYLHQPENPEKLPFPVHATGSGLAVCARSMGRAVRGDCLMQMLSETSGSEIGEKIALSG